MILFSAFNYLENKDHVLRVMAEIQHGRGREAIAASRRGTHTIHSILHRLVRQLVEEPGRSPGLAHTFISSFLASEGVRIIIEHNMREGRKMIAQIVAAGQERGEIDSTLKRKWLRCNSCKPAWELSCFGRWMKRPRSKCVSKTAIATFGELLLSAHEQK